MELNDYLNVFRRHWLGIALFVAVGVGIAGGISFQQPKVYAASASGFVSTGSSQGAAEASVGDSLAKSRATSYVDLAKSRSVARDVANELSIKENPASLIGRIGVVQPVDTVLIKITARDSSPAGARELADTWVTALSNQVAAIENPRGRSDSLKLVPIESAELPSVPVSPNIKRNLLLGFLAGLVLGGAFALTRSQLDRRITSAGVIERDFGVTVAAAIPATNALERDKNGLARMVVAGPVTSTGDSHAREAFLKLRTNMQFMHVDNPPRIIVVTSPLPGDGKSTVAANLAASLSVAGSSVLLIDGDLRRPVVAEQFGLVEGPGLTDVIIGRAEIHEVLQEVQGLPHLWILSAGKIPPNPSELLGSNAMRQILKRISDEFIVVIDAPPLLPVTDAAVLTAAADGALIVISSGKTLDTQLHDSLKLVDKVQGQALGVVFNRVKKRDSASGYYGEYYGGYQPMKASRGRRGKRRDEGAPQREAPQPTKF